MNAIQNIYDGPKKPRRQLNNSQFELDFAYSTSPEEVDAGIKETIRGVKL